MLRFRVLEAPRAEEITEVARRTLDRLARVCAEGRPGLRPQDRAEHWYVRAE
ncbi:hypothetical protein G6O69_34485 [Pseudenhygromyxa sp. WMMC2535]|uniref:hypothetical protein n=1 Tax=Pseudenhygromyxa sp. WMMC2535 TaxID=2712867 RepID=UPI0015951453|nr:hypothetical protein [Pseudenhygromyxa sp. WMMC2535]NVB42981.1 hypothetical protein [Pseudenhygromyxa sp. WMMC2535]